MNFSAKNLFIICLVSILALFASASMVLAEGEAASPPKDPDDISKTEVRQRTKELRDQIGQELSDEDRKRLIAEFKGLTSEQKCYEATLNMRARIELYQANHTEFIFVYDLLLDNARAASDRLFDLKLKVTSLNDSIDALEDDLFAVKSSYFSLIDNLETNLEIVCEDDFADTNTLKDSLNYITEIKTGIEDVQEEVQNVLESFTELLAKPAEEGK